jgi:S1-C subfamily serine protease
VLVEGVRTGGAAHRGGLRRGVVIEAVEGEPIKSLQDFEQRYDNLSEAETARVLLQVRRYESQAYVLLQINHGENKDSGQ